LGDQLVAGYSFIGCMIGIAFFFLVALVFVYRSFYGMRIPEQK